MTHPLEAKIARVRSRVRRLLLLYGLSGFLATLVTAVIVLGLLDYLARIDDRGVRVMATLAVVSAGGWGLWRFLMRAWRTHFSDVELARRAERAFPELADRLSSTIHFLHQSEDDPRAGSPTLRRTVIAETAAAVEHLDLTRAIEPRPAMRVTLIASGVMLLAALLLVLDPQSARTAVARLVNPLARIDWPRATELVVVNPVTRVPLGQSFELRVADAQGRSLPNDVRVFYRYEGGQESATETMEVMQTQGDQALARKEAVSRPFAYRVEAGDDTSMPWQTVEIVEPPAIETLAVELHYPAYTAWPKEPSDKMIETLEGTTIRLQGTSTKPLSTAAVRNDDAPLVAAAVSQDGYTLTVPATPVPAAPAPIKLAPIKPAAVASAGTSGQGGTTPAIDKAETSSTEFIARKSGTYRLLLTDREGFTNGEGVAYELRVRPDAAPQVLLPKPAADIHVTADASVPLVIDVTDDLAIAKVALSYTRSDRTDAGTIELPLYGGPATAAPAVVGRAALAGGAAETRRIEYTWNLAELELAPGAEVMFQATAGDYRPQLGNSTFRRLTVITRSELMDRIAQRQSAVLAELARLTQLQRDARGQVSGVEIQLGQVGQLVQQDVDHLQAAELTQRQVERGLTSTTEGLPIQIGVLLDDLRNNKLDSPDVERQMQTLVDTLAKLSQEQLPPLANQLTSALKASQSQVQAATMAPETTADAARHIGAPLAAAAKHQDVVIETLSGLLGELSQWDNFSRFRREVDQLRRDQQELTQGTAESGKATLTKDVQDLTSQQTADLKKLATRQGELARRFDDMQGRMAEMATRLREQDPVAAGSLTDALQEAQRQAVSGQMREAGRQVEQNQMGQAAGRQASIDQALAEMQDILANRRERELTGLVKKLREAEQELADLRARQEGLRKKMAEADANPNEAQRRKELERLSREQRELEKESESLARKLERLQASDASKSTQQAGKKMGQAGGQSEQGNGQKAGEQAEAAEKDLDQAQQQLAEKRAQAEADLAAEQVARLTDTVKALRDRQAKVHEETIGYETIREQAGRLSRSQLISVRDLARTEQGLEQETAAVSEKLVGAEVFQLALEGARGDMLRAAAMLEARETGLEPQAAMANVLARFDRLLAAMKPDSQAGDDNQQPPGQKGGTPAQQRQHADAIRSLAELKLLKLMQEDVNRRTADLETAFQNSQSLSPEQEQEYVQLSSEQGQLADLLLNLSQPTEEDPGENPENFLDPAEDPDSEPLEDVESDPAESVPDDTNDAPAKDDPSSDAQPDSEQPDSEQPEIEVTGPNETGPTQE